MIGYSIGSNDLTMLVLGADRDNETVQHIYDERNLAVKRAIRHLIEVAHKVERQFLSVVRLLAYTQSFANS